MKNRLLGLALLGLILFLTGGILFTWGTPRLLEVSPADQATDIAANAPLRLTFSRPMQAGSVEQRLAFDPPRSGRFSWQGNSLTFTPDQPWPGGATVRVQLARGARAAGLLSLPLSQEGGWSFTVGHPSLVYLYPSDGLADLYLLNPFTGENRRITDIPGEATDFSPSPDGASIYFSVSQADGSGLYRWDRPIGETSQLLDCPQAFCRAVQVSPQGDLLAYERTSLAGAESGEFPQVWLLPLPAREPTGSESTPTPAEPRLAMDPGHSTQGAVWSPEGLLSLFDASLSAFILIDPQSGEVARFSGQTGLPGSWDPGGESYVISEIFSNPLNDTQAPAGIQPVPSNHLLRYQRSDGKLEDLTQADDLDDAAPAFSPQGDLLAFARKYLDLDRWTPGRQLWIMRPDGSNAQPLTDEATFNHYDFAWSPDGNELAYVRFNQNAPAEPPEIWLVDLEGGQAQELVIGGYAPRWIP